MTTPKAIPTSVLIAMAQHRSHLAIEGAAAALERLKNNKIDWLVAQGVLDTCRLDMLSAGNVLLELLADHPAEHCEVSAIMHSAMTQIDARGEVMTKSYLLNGPKAVLA